MGRSARPTLRCLPREEQMRLKELVSYISQGQRHIEPVDLAGPLRARRQRPRCRAAEQRDEGAPFHYSMTSSARAVNAADKVMPSAVAVFRLIAK